MINRLQNIRRNIIILLSGPILYNKVLLLFANELHSFDFKIIMKQLKLKTFGEK